jgi:hypothetical protein
MTDRDERIDITKPLHRRAREAERAWRAANGLGKRLGKAPMPPEAAKPVEKWQRKRQRDRQERRALRHPLLKGV